MDMEPPSTRREPPVPDLRSTPSASQKMTPESVKASNMPTNSLKTKYLRQLTADQDNWLKAYAETLVDRDFTVTRERLKKGADYIVRTTHERDPEDTRPLDISKKTLDRWISKNPSFNVLEDAASVRRAGGRKFTPAEHNVIVAICHSKTFRRNNSKGAVNGSRSEGLGTLPSAAAQTPRGGRPSRSSKSKSPELLQISQDEFSERFPEFFPDGFSSDPERAVSERPSSMNNPHTSTISYEIATPSRNPTPLLKQSSSVVDEEINAPHVMEIPETRVLAIASHVVHGYVGNKVATFVLQVMGCDVSSINTVNYSNHTGYKRVSGTKAFPFQIKDLFGGLEEIDSDEFDVVLSGYLPERESIVEVGAMVRKLRKKSKNVFWSQYLGVIPENAINIPIVMDPVMGDDGKFYVPQESVEEFRGLLDSADLILPNQFELEALTGQPVESLKDVLTAIGKLHAEQGVKNVLITSTDPSLAKEELDAGRLTAPEPAHPGDPSRGEYMLLIGSSQTSDKKPRVFAIVVPRFPVSFTGTGDMFSALLTANLRATAKDLSPKPGWLPEDTVGPAELPLAKAASRAVDSMQKVLAKTYASYIQDKAKVDADMGLTQQDRHVRTMRALELRVVRNIADLFGADGERYSAWELSR